MDDTRAPRYERPMPLDTTSRSVTPSSRQPALLGTMTFGRFARRDLKVLPRTRAEDTRPRVAFGFDASRALAQAGCRAVTAVAAARAVPRLFHRCGFRACYR